MNDKRNLATYVFSASIFCLAAALVYFTLEINRIRSQLPAILDKVETTSENIKPIVTEVIKARDLVPPLTNEITELRKQIPSILQEVKQTRELIPPILKEVKQTRELVPPILKEVKKTREAIPPMLVKAENIVKQARFISKETSEGAVTGVFTGIIKAPFKLIGGMFGSVNLKVDGMKAKDQQLAIKAVTDALSVDKIGEPYSWSNPDSGNNGVITITEKKVIDERDCRLITALTTVADNEAVKKDVTVCLMMITSGKS